MKVSNVNFEIQICYYPLNNREIFNLILIILVLRPFYILLKSVKQTIRKP